MHHFLAAPRAMAVAVEQTRWQREADALPGARRLLVYSTVALLLLAGTVFGATVFAVFQIDEASVGHELSRGRLALTAVSVDTEGSEAALASTLANSYALKNARVGDTASIATDEIALQLNGHHDRLLIWTPRRLGTELFMELAPIRILASVIFLLGIALLMRRLYTLASELEDRRVEAQALATRDALTGLGNRLAFDEGIERMQAEGIDAFALFYLDLDGFKQVNDTLGHGAGDDVLRTVGHRLGALMLPTDLLVRLGGDEFVVLRGTYSSREELERLALTIEAALAEPVQLGTRSLPIGVSIGIATAPADGASGIALLAAADTALYRAKRDRSGFAMANAA